MKIIIFLIAIMFSIQTAFSQQAKDLIVSLADIAWPLFAEPYISKKVNDELTREIFKTAVPKLIHEDYEGAIKEICNSISKIKNIKVLNVDFLSMLRKETKIIKDFIDKKDFLNAAVKVTELGLNINSYIKSGILTQQNTEVKTADISSTTKEQIKQDISADLDKKMYMSRFDDYAFYISTGTCEANDWGDRKDEDKKKDNPDSFTDQYEVKRNNTESCGMIVTKVIAPNMYVPENDLYKKKDELGMQLKEMFKPVGINILNYEFKNYQHINNVFKCKIYHQNYESKGYLYLIIRGSAIYQVYVLADNRDKNIDIMNIAEEIINSFVVVSDNSLNDKIAKKNQNKKITDNIKDYVSVSGTYNKQIVGTTGLVLNVVNRTGFQLDKVVVEVKFYGELTKKLYCNKLVTIENVSDKKSVSGPTCENGKSIEVKIKKIISNDLDLNVDL